MQGTEQISVSRGPGAGGWVSALVPPALLHDGLGILPKKLLRPLGWRGVGWPYQGIPFLSALWVLLLKLHLVRLSHLKVCGKTG